MELSDQEMLRYNRQIILKSVDFDGQEKVKSKPRIDYRAWRFGL